MRRQYWSGSWRACAVLYVARLAVSLSWWVDGQELPLASCVLHPLLWDFSRNWKRRRVVSLFIITTTCFAWLLLLLLLLLLLWAAPSNALCAAQRPLYTDMQRLYMVTSSWRLYRPATNSSFMPHAICLPRSIVCLNNLIACVHSQYTLTATTHMRALLNHSLNEVIKNKRNNLKTTDVTTNYMACSA